MQQITESIDTQDAKFNEISNKAANDQTDVGDQLLIMRQSSNDRNDISKKFDEEIAKAEENLNKLAIMLAEPKENKSVEYIENIIKRSEVFSSDILTLKNLAETAIPIEEPRRKIDALLQRQASFIANAKEKAKQTEENEKGRAYTQKLAVLEEELKAIEHTLQTSIQLKTAETLKGFSNDSVRPLYDKFEALEEAPNEELKERREKLKSAFIKLKNNADEKAKKVVQHENLVKNIDAQISQHETALADILSRYENAQPVSKVKEHIHELEKMIEPALMLPLDEITEKSTRKKFSKRIEPLRAEVNEVLQSLIEELDNVRHIQTTYDNVAEKLLSTENNMTVTTQETPVKIFSKSAEIGEVLLILRQELETIAQSLTKPMKFVEIPRQIKSRHLENKLNEVATNIAKMVKKVVYDQKFALFAPQIEALTVYLQSTINEGKNAPTASLEQQESTLRMLEAEKQKITTLLESIPEDAKEAETIKEKSTWELGRLADLIKRLGRTVGEKVAAFSNFIETKAKIESQLTEIDRTLEGEDASARPNISTLVEQQQKVEKFREKLCAENTADSLDSKERSTEFNQLMISLELRLIKITNARETVEQETALKKVAELQKSKVNWANNELVSLIEQSFRLQRKLTEAQDKNTEALEKKLNDLKMNLEHSSKVDFVTNSQQRRPQNLRGGFSSKNIPSGPCHKCSKFGHWRSECPNQKSSQSNITCYNCRFVGHYASSCRKPRKNQATSSNTVQQEGNLAPVFGQRAAPLALPRNHEATRCRKSFKRAMTNLETEPNTEKGVNRTLEIVQLNLEENREKTRIEGKSSGKCTKYPQGKMRLPENFAQTYEKARLTERKIRLPA